LRAVQTHSKYISADAIASRRKSKLQTACASNANPGGVSRRTGSASESMRQSAVRRVFGRCAASCQGDLCQGVDERHQSLQGRVERVTQCRIYAAVGSKMESVDLGQALPGNAHQRRNLARSRPLTWCNSSLRPHALCLAPETLCTTPTRPGSRQAHECLYAAVLAAYGWPADLDREDTCWPGFSSSTWRELRARRQGINGRPGRPGRFEQASAGCWTRGCPSVLCLS